MRTLGGWVDPIVDDHIIEIVVVIGLDGGTVSLGHSWKSQPSVERNTWLRRTAPSARVVGLPRSAIGSGGVGCPCRGHLAR